jgi:hypothetical protein
MQSPFAGLFAEGAKNEMRERRLNVAGLLFDTARKRIVKINPYFNKKSCKLKFVRYLC